MKTAAATNIASRQNPVKQGMVARGADNLETRYKDMNGNEVFVSLVGGRSLSQGSFSWLGAQGDAQ